MKRCRGRRSCPKRYAIDSTFLRATSDSSPRTEVWACAAGSWRQNVSTKGAIKVSNRGITWSKIWGATWHSSSNCCLRMAYSASIQLLLPGIVSCYRIHGGHS
jgi:hypothetical protein